MRSRRWPGNSEGHETAYQVYGLSLDFDEEVLAAIHKRKTREHHPDAGGDREQFERYQRAYEVLTDPAQRFDERKREEARLEARFSGSQGNAEYQGSYEDGFTAGERHGRASTHAAYKQTYGEPSPQHQESEPTDTPSPRMLRALRVVHGIALMVLTALMALAGATDDLTSGFTVIFSTVCVALTFALTYQFSFKVLLHFAREPIGIGVKLLIITVGYGAFLLAALVTNIFGTGVALVAFLGHRIVTRLNVVNRRRLLR